MKPIQTLRGIATLGLIPVLSFFTSCAVLFDMRRAVAGLLDEAHRPLPEENPPC